MSLGHSVSCWLGENCAITYVLNPLNPSESRVYSHSFAFFFVDAFLVSTGDTTTRWLNYREKYSAETPDMALGKSGPYCGPHLFKDSQALSSTSPTTL
jgi:hypothetical protein